MWARFTVLNETPIASAIAGCVIPLSRSSTICMRSRCAAGIFHRSAVFNCRICFLVHLTIRPPESDSQSESYCAPSREPEKRQKSLDSNSYGSGIRQFPAWFGRSLLALRRHHINLTERRFMDRPLLWTIDRKLLRHPAHLVFPKKALFQNGLSGICTHLGWMPIDRFQFKTCRPTEKFSPLSSAL